MAKIDQIAADVRLLRTHLVEKIPGHFSTRHVVSAFFGAVLFALTFVLKGLLFQVGLALDWTHIVLIIVSTLLTLTAEIYFVGYARLSEEHRRIRPFGQFWFKRITAYYFIAIFVSLLLVWIYGLSLFTGNLFGTFKIIVAVSMPAAIGAGLADLLGKY